MPPRPAEPRAMATIIDGRHRLRGYPPYYTLRVTGGWGLFAITGRHRGSALGHLGTDGLLRLYGRANFAARGGLAWQHGRAHYYMEFRGGRWRRMIQRCSRCGSRFHTRNDCPERM